MATVNGAAYDERVVASCQWARAGGLHVDAKAALPQDVGNVLGDFLGRSKLTGMDDE